MSILNQLSKKYVKADEGIDLSESGDELIKLATELSKHAKILISIGKAWSKTEGSDIKKILRHEGIAKLRIQQVMNTARTLNDEFGSK